MTVQQLIEELSTRPPDMLVIIEGYEGGFEDIKAIEVIPIKMNVHRDRYVGDHENVPLAESDCEALLFAREDKFTQSTI